jgi:type II secretory pathway pseudopilin PulG
MKKAAMFGLDARIALAIFGALSVISGAALYSAIQDAKVTAFLVDINEAGKAYEQYYLDTGAALPIADVSNLSASYLINENGVAGWNGPYLPYRVSPAWSHGLEYNTRFQNGILYFTKVVNADFPSPGVCTDITNCALYVSVSSPIAETYLKEMALLLSKRIDGNTNLLTGKVRTYESATTYYLYFKYGNAFAVN